MFIVTLTHVSSAVAGVRVTTHEFNTLDEAKKFADENEFFEGDEYCHSECEASISKA